MSSPVNSSNNTACGPSHLTFSIKCFEVYCWLGESPCCCAYLVLVGIRLWEDPGLHLKLVRRFVPVRVFRTKERDKPWFDDGFRRAFDIKQSANNRWVANNTGLYYDWSLEIQKETKLIGAVTEWQCNNRSRHILRTAANAYRWWFILKSVVIGSNPTYAPSYRRERATYCWFRRNYKSVNAAFRKQATT